ncbi:MAG: TetR/AcrR family transcriptional regulator [Chloroflexota bacterium]
MSNSTSTSSRFDRKKEETREKVKRAYVDLLHQKSYEDITVREIAAEAGIGYKTYYRHYADKSALSQAILNDLWLEFIPHIEAPASRDAVGKTLRRILIFVSEHARTIRALTRTPALNDVPQPILQYGLADALKIEEQTGDPVLDQKRNELIAMQFVYGQFNMVRWWLENDMVLPLDDMVALISHMVIEPIWTLPSVNE